MGILGCCCSFVDKVTKLPLDSSSFKKHREADTKWDNKTSFTFHKEAIKEKPVLGWWTFHPMDVTFGQRDSECWTD